MFLNKINGNTTFRAVLYFSRQKVTFRAIKKIALTVTLFLN